MNEKVREALDRLQLGVNELRQKCKSGGQQCEICDSQGEAIATIRAHIEGVEARADELITAAYLIGVDKSIAADARMRELEADSARYRWLQLHANRVEWCLPGCEESDEWETVAETVDPDYTLDAAIDAAMQENRDG
jgi:hypothetical protein